MRSTTKRYPCLPDTPSLHCSDRDSPSAARSRRRPRRDGGSARGQAPSLSARTMSNSADNAGFNQNNTKRKTTRAYAGKLLELDFRSGPTRGVLPSGRLQQPLSRACRKPKSIATETNHVMVGVRVAKAREVLRKSCSQKCCAGQTPSLPSAVVEGGKRRHALFWRRHRPRTLPPTLSNADTRPANHPVK